MLDNQGAGSLAGRLEQLRHRRRSPTSRTAALHDDHLSHPSNPSACRAGKERKKAMDAACMNPMSTGLSPPIIAANCSTFRAPWNPPRTIPKNKPFAAQERSPGGRNDDHRWHHERLCAIRSHFSTEQSYTPRRTKQNSGPLAGVGYLRGGPVGWGAMAGKRARGHGPWGRWGICTR